ncbi:MAG: hypothetical protein JST90_08175 [Bacteroidetes bacterium]|nr:hypothetical protein [Bacteroidota bacterium]
MKNTLVILAFTLLLASCRHRQYTVLRVVPCMEECDSYWCIWRVDSVLTGDSSLTHTHISLQSGAYDYEYKDSANRYLLKGIYTTREIWREGVMCGTVYEYYDSSFVKIK